MNAAMSTASNAIKTGLFTLLVPLVVGVWIPQRMIANPGVAVAIAWRVVGGLLFVVGVIGYCWCAALFVRAQGTPAPIFPTKEAVVSGPYRINRNPMYTSVLAVVFGHHLFVVLYEERDLRARFDGQYEEFCRRVPRWVPRLRDSWHS